MSKHYLEKALLATNYKIQNVKEQSGFFKKNINPIIIAGVVFSFCLPYYSNDEGNSIGDYLKLSYTDSVVFVATVVFSFCLIGHLSWTIQDKRRLKQLLKRKQELEDQINSYDL